MCPSNPQGSLNLTLSVPLCCATTTSSFPCHCNGHIETGSDQDLAAQICRDFASQLATNLGNGPFKVLLEDKLNDILANNQLREGGAGAIRKATQTLAARYANELVEKFPKRLARCLSSAGNVEESIGVSFYPSLPMGGFVEYIDFVVRTSTTNQGRIQRLPCGFYPKTAVDQDV
jgi:hypothetical protein